MNLNIVLVEPEIPQNTGNIARTCAAIGAKLHLVYPLGFSISEREVKRAGLDYWDKLDIEEHTSFNKFLEKYNFNIISLEENDHLTDKTIEDVKGMIYRGEIDYIFVKEGEKISHTIKQG